MQLSLSYKVFRCHPLNIMLYVGSQLHSNPSYVASQLPLCFFQLQLTNAWPQQISKIQSHVQLGRSLLLLISLAFFAHQLGIFLAFHCFLSNVLFSGSVAPLHAMITMKDMKTTMTLSSCLQLHSILLAYSFIFIAHNQCACVYIYIYIYIYLSYSSNI